MLSAIIEDRINNWNCLLSFNKDNRNINVLSIKDGCICNDNTRLNEILNLFVLGKNQKKIGLKDNFDVILDLDTGLYHYLKDGIEDIEKLYTLNGENATSFSKQDKDNSCINKLARKFKKNGFTILFTSFAAFASIAGVNYSMRTKTSDYKEAVVFTQLDDSTFEIVNAQYIKDAIYNSCNLNDAEKEFLCNEELINDILPYYEKDLFSGSIIKARVNNIDIVPFTEEEKEAFPTYDGYQAYDNILHILDYKDTFLVDDSSSWPFMYMYKKRVIGHEFIHLLQMNTDLKMLSEAVAEIMAHEYFLESADYTYKYSYNNHSRYIKVLMEIFGPDIIKERVFQSNSTRFEDTVKQYFSDDEYIEFMDIIKCKPDDLTSNQCDRLVELISILYKNNFNTDMKDNDLIQTILYSEKYNRAYFSKSLMEKSPSCYLNLRDGYNNHNIDFYFKEVVSEDGTHIKIDDNVLNDKVKQNHALCAIYNIDYAGNYDKIMNYTFYDGTIKIYCKDGSVYEEQLERAIDLGWLVPVNMSEDSEYFMDDKAKIFIIGKYQNDLEIEDFKFIDGMMFIKDIEENCFEISSEEAFELGYLFDISTITYYVSYDEYIKESDKYEIESKIGSSSSIVYIDNITSTLDSSVKAK